MTCQCEEGDKCDNKTEEGYGKVDCPQQQQRQGTCPRWLDKAEVSLFSKISK